MFHSACTRHTTNVHNYFRGFVESECVVHADNNEMNPSYGHKMMKVTTVVEGVRHHISLQDLLYAPYIIFNLFLASMARKNAFRINSDDDRDDSGLEKL